MYLEHPQPPYVMLLAAFAWVASLKWSGQFDFERDACFQRRCPFTKEQVFLPSLRNGRGSSGTKRQWSLQPALLSGQLTHRDLVAGLPREPEVQVSSTFSWGSASEPV